MGLECPGDAGLGCKLCNMLFAQNSARASVRYLTYTNFYSSGEANTHALSHQPHLHSRSSAPQTKTAARRFNFRVGELPTPQLNPDGKPWCLDNDHPRNYSSHLTALARHRWKANNRMIRIHGPSSLLARADLDLLLIIDRCIATACCTSMRNSVHGHVKNDTASYCCFFDNPYLRRDATTLAPPRSRILLHIYLMCRD